MSTDIKCPKCGHILTMEDAVSEEYKRELRDQMMQFKKEKEEEVRLKEQAILKQKEELGNREKQLRDQLENQEKSMREQLNNQEKALREKMDIQERLMREKMDNHDKLMREQLQKKQEEYELNLKNEKLQIQQSLEKELKESIRTDFENQLKSLTENQAATEEKLKEARRRELEFLQKEQALKTKEEEMEINIQRQLLAERQSLSEQIRKEEMDKISLKETEYQLKMRELEKQLDDQKKLAEEMRRKAEQGSMQLQGEAQELLLEEILRNNFPFDTVMEVGKGVEGADCMLLVRNPQGQECGKIIFESKRAKGWNNNWVEKLRNDMRNQQADLAILVTQVYPKGMDCFGEKDGVWICSFKEVSGLATALRNAIISISDTRKSEENKGEKMQMLYNFLTGIEFRQQVEAIVEGFTAMRQSIIKERIQMEKLWKEREKQLEKVLINTSGMYGSIKGIAGSSISSIPLLEAGEDEEEE